MAEPSITDWISSVGTLIGIPTAIWGIISLFKKNKDQERKLNSLAALAESQNKVALRMNDQIQELSRHTSEFQHQTQLMKESNEMTRLSLDIQAKVQEESQAVEAEKLKLQRMVRISSIRPHFTFSGLRSSPETGFRADLINKGHLAKKVSLTEVGSGFVNLTPLPEGKEYENNERLNFQGFADLNKTYLNSNTVPFDIEISYEDIDGNEYVQVLKKQNSSVFLTTPQLKER